MRVDLRAPDACVCVPLCTATTGDSDRLHVSLNRFVVMIDLAKNPETVIVMFLHECGGGCLRPPFRISADAAPAAIIFPCSLGVGGYLGRAKDFWIFCSLKRKRLLVE